MALSNLTNNDLVRAGFSQDQVIVLHDYLQDRATQDYRNLVSSNELKAHSSDLKLEISVAKTELNAKISEVKLEIAALRTEVKQDIADVRQEIAALRTEVKQDIANVRQEIAEFRTEVKQDIAEIRTEVKQDISRLEINMSKQFADLHRWLIGLLIGLFFSLVTVMVALLTYFSKQ